MKLLSKSILKHTTATALALSSSHAWAVPIAIIDSGTDLKHAALVDHAWTNPGGIAGDEYKDDTHGWNFAENNNQIIDYSYMGKFSSDTTKYFEIQLKKLNGTASEEEIKWLEEKRKDEKFISELSTFANFVHGTHVSGIASRSAPKAQIMAAKIMPTEVKKPSEEVIEQIREVARRSTPSLLPFFALPRHPEDSRNDSGGGFMDEIMMKIALSMVVQQQAKTLDPIGKYVNALGMKAANCSFGTGIAQAKMVVGLLGKNLLNRDLTSEETEKYAKQFLKDLLEKGKGWVTLANKTLFVIAAGNDASDNDVNPDYPGNLRLENTITVAATRNYERLASFSNYGATTVDIAAPGVGILSSVPTPAENESMAMSGTSQAAPFITRLAGMIMDENPQLSVADVKKIMMLTVDKKSSLEGKVVSGGVANVERAVYAAQQSVHNPLDEAIKRANADVKDFVPFYVRLKAFGMTRNRMVDNGDDGEPVRLPSLIQATE